MKPTFMIIGAMKSGTTSLWQYLSVHPEIFMCYPKEPGFFVEELNWREGWDWYCEFFAGAGDAKARGEASTYYTMLPKHERVVEKVAEHLPSVKLLYIMREPVARAVSHYWHNVGRFNERRPMEKAIRQEAEYTDFGRYAFQLRPWLERFPRDQFHFIAFEELKASPLDVIREVYEFLGVDSRFQPEIAGKAYNETPDVLKARRHLLHRIRWSPWWDRVSHLVPSFLKDLGKRLEYRSIPRTRGTPEEVRLYLEDIYRGENENLFEIIGRRYPCWSNREKSYIPAEQLA